MLNRYFALAGALFMGGILLLLLSVIRGEGSAGIAVFIPFFYGTGPFSSMGVLLVFLGMLAFFYSFIRGEMSAAPGEVDEDWAPESRPADGPSEKRATPAPPQEPAGPGVRGGAVILIGPVPIVFGSDRAAARNLMMLALALMIAALIFLGFLAMR
jgi:uncharacterized protein (TIGR00304 family)